MASLMFSCTQSQVSFRKNPITPMNRIRAQGFSEFGFVIITCTVTDLLFAGDKLHMLIHREKNLQLAVEVKSQKGPILI